MSNSTLSHSFGKVGKTLATLAATFCLTLAASNASAVPFGNPNPGDLSDDIDGTGYFNPGTLGSLAGELFDLGDTSSEFGFFAQGTPGTLIPIFEPADVLGSAATIDFAGGLIFDVEDNGIQSIFAGTDSIGFYLTFMGHTLYSDPLLNPNGADLMGAYASNVDEYLSILFFAGPSTGAAAPTLLSWHAISDMNAATVPVPSSMILMILGLGALVSRRTR